MEKTLAISTAVASAAVNTVVVEEFRDEFEGNAKMEEFIAAMKRWGLDPTEKLSLPLSLSPSLDRESDIRGKSMVPSPPFLDAHASVRKQLTKLFRESLKANVLTEPYVAKNGVKHADYQCLLLHKEGSNCATEEVASRLLDHRF